MSSTFIKNCLKGDIKTGLGSCNKQFFGAKKPYLIQRNKTISLTNGVFTEVTYNQLIQKGELIDLGDIISIEDLTIEAQTVEISRIPHKIGNAIYGFKLNFKGYSCNKHAYKNAENSKWDLIWADKKGNLVCLPVDENTLKGLKIESLYFERLTIFNSEDIAKFSFNIYLSEKSSEDLEENGDILDVSNIEVELLDKQGIIDVNISRVGTTNNIKIVENCSKTASVTGLQTSNFRFLDATGVVISTAAISEVGDGIYTVAGVTGACTIELYDNSVPANVIIYTNEYYSSNKLATVF